MIMNAKQTTDTTEIRPPFRLAIDLGGMSAKLGLFHSGSNRPASGSGRIRRPALLGRTTVPTRLEEQGRYILPDIAAAAQKLAGSFSLSLSDISGAGIGVPGPVLPETDRGFPVKGCVNLGWEGILYPGETLRELTGIENIFVCNDANAAALGELYFGPSQDALPSNAVMITIGTGIGGGIIQNGQIVTGAFGAAGEVGHMPVGPVHPLLRTLHESVPDLRLSADLEYYASARGIVRIANAVLKTSEYGELGTQAFEGPSALQEIARSGTLEARHVLDAAKAGDPAGLLTAEFFFETLGQGLAAIASVADPDLFIIGGGVSAAGDYLLQGLRQSYRRLVFHASRDTEFRLAVLGNDAGLLGPLVPLLRSPASAPASAARKQPRPPEYSPAPK